VVADGQFPRQLVIELRSHREGQILPAAAHAIDGSGRKSHRCADNRVRKEQTQQRATGGSCANFLEIREQR